ncbi:hypothetical protein [Allorhizocola rhizosphaerae]|uniref:hypothetical protein n=1 Tax=Allorhizocola rhizosphaerae TaxID=1872709 RepID=UPI001B8CABE6|nr:hypothetical protein [Allorhizocola rhizosphaerae]
MYFVYRSHYEGPLGKHVRRLPDTTVLGWFKRGWASSDPSEFVEAELGADVYGLDTILEAAQTDDLPEPQTDEQLRALLHEHLYVEGGEDYIRLDDHSLRVRTDDDEVELAYFFLDEHIAEAAPDRLAYLLHESWPLPDEGIGSERFDPTVPVTAITQAGANDVTTYAVFLTYYDGESLARLQPLAFAGVALPELTQHLQSIEVPDRDWPVELTLLRALIAPGEQDLRQALLRCNRWPGFNLNADWPQLPPAHEAAHQTAAQLMASAEFTSGRRPEKSLLHVSDHAAQLAMHCDETFGYQQWYLFDTVWAATHPSLAQSLLRYANHWDPLE